METRLKFIWVFQIRYVLGVFYEAELSRHFHFPFLGQHAFYTERVCCKGIDCNQETLSPE